MSSKYSQLIKNKITEKLVNPNFDPTFRADASEFLFSNKQTMFEQYKLLVDSAHKIEERRGGSNNIFLGINTLLASFLVRPTQFVEMQTKDMPVLILLTLIGVLISWEWLKVTASYKKLNFINYYLLEAFEKYFPTYVFSLRAKIETTEEGKEKSNSKANIILIKENLLPKAFLLLYLIYLITILFYLFN